MWARNRIGLVALLALAACAPQPWSKPEASAEQMEQDKRACDDEAYREVLKRYAAITNVPPAVATDSQARRFNIYPARPFADQYGTQLQEESRLADACMRAKGYAQRGAKPK